MITKYVKMFHIPPYKLNHIYTYASSLLLRTNMYYKHLQNKENKIQLKIQTRFCRHFVSISRKAWHTWQCFAGMVIADSEASSTKDDSTTTWNIHVWRDPHGSHTLTCPRQDSWQRGLQWDAHTPTRESDFLHHTILHSQLLPAHCSGKGSHTALSVNCLSVNWGVCVISKFFI